MQRSIVLDLLSSIKGVSIHEQGKIQRASNGKGKGRSQMMEQYMSVDQPADIVRGTSPGLAGVADMFGGS
jgi:exportin-5